MSTTLQRLAVAVVIVFCCLPSKLLALQIFPKLCDVRNFDDYLEQTGKVYNDPAVRAFRESIFIGKKTVVDMGNKAALEGHSFFLDINPLADLTSEEIARITGSRITFLGENITSQHINFVTNKVSENDNLPDEFDWRVKGGVTPPRFQGFDCGACWSLATTATLEGHLFRRTGVLVDLSPQDLVDCASDYGSEGCEGGFQEYAFEYIRDHGITLESKYPYVQMENGQCKRNESDGSIQIRNYARIKPGDEQKMKEVIATLGPLACSINAAPITMQHYRSGVYNDDACNQEDVNHAIVVVGYGTEGGQDYWIVKNSWSENWGENGFIKILRNANSFCGIASECSYPVL